MPFEDEEAGMSLISDAARRTVIGAVKRPKWATTSVMKLCMLRDTQPRCAWHDSQMTDAGCLAPSGPINAVVHPQSHGSGRSSRSPRIDLVALFGSAARRSVAACAVSASRVGCGCKANFFQPPGRVAAAGRFSFMETSGRRRAICKSRPRRSVRMLGQPDATAP
jgi:hypothetical protein